MPEVAEQPKPFSQQLRESLPKSGDVKSAPSPQTAAPKPEAEKPKPNTATSDPDAEILEGKRAPKGDDFKRVKHAATEANKRADELKAGKEAADKELAELKKRPVHNADLIAKLERERNEYKAKFEQVAVEIDPVKIAEHQGRLKAVQDSVKALSPDKADELLAIFAMPAGERQRRALAEAVEDMDPITVDDINAARREYNAVLAARQSEIAKANETLNTMAGERQKQQQERKTAYEKSFDSVLAAKSAGDDALPVLQTREGDTPEVKVWNDGVELTKKVARAIFMDEFETPEEKAEASIWAASAKGFLEELKAAQAENATLKETLGKLQSSTPGLRAEGGKGGSPEKSFTQRMQDAVRKTG